MADKIFIDGFISNDVPETAPAFILGKGAFQVDRLREWLEKNRGLANDAGYINYTVKRSQTTNKRYVEVDTYKAGDSKKSQGEVPKTGGYEGEVVPTIDYGETGVNVDDIPF